MKEEFNNNIKKELDNTQLESFNKKLLELIDKNDKIIQTKQNKITLLEEELEKSIIELQELLVIE